MIEIDMAACEACGLERALHVGYNHKERRCLVAASYLDLAIIFGEARAKEIVRRINENRTIAAAEGGAA